MDSVAGQRVYAAGRGDSLKLLNGEAEKLKKDLPGLQPTFPLFLFGYNPGRPVSLSDYKRFNETLVIITIAPVVILSGKIKVVFTKLVGKVDAEASHVSSTE